MNRPADPASMRDTISIHVPMDLRKHGRRKLIVVPTASAPPPPPKPSASRTLRLLVRAFHWLRRLDVGEFSTLSELAKSEKIDKSQLSRVLRLTTLAPDIVEAILNGWEPPTRIDRIANGLPNDWEEQRKGTGLHP
jgi:hypothetical protein